MVKCEQVSVYDDRCLASLYPQFASVDRSAMEELLETLQQLLPDLELNQFPSLARIVESMDPIAWTLTALLVSAVLLGIFFSLSTRRSYLRSEEVETTPDVTLARLKQDPTQLPPLAIVSRLGSEATLELLEYGDQTPTNEWRYRWGAVREQLIYLLSQQNAFGPTYALARYYRSEDTHEPDTLRIRRTASDAQARTAAAPGGGCRRESCHSFACVIIPRRSGANLASAARHSGCCRTNRCRRRTVHWLRWTHRVSYLAGCGDSTAYSSLAHRWRRLSTPSAQTPQDVGCR